MGFNSRDNVFPYNETLCSKGRNDLFLYSETVRFKGMKQVVSP